jgi:hypothetical protein
MVSHVAASSHVHFATKVKKKLKFNDFWSVLRLLNKAILTDQDECFNPESVHVPWTTSTNIVDLTMRTSVLRFPSLQTASYPTGPLDLKTKAPCFFRNIDNWLPRNARRTQPLSQPARSVVPPVDATTRCHQSVQQYLKHCQQVLGKGAGLFHRIESLQPSRRPVKAATLTVKTNDTLCRSCNLSLPLYESTKSKLREMKGL